MVGRALRRSIDRSFRAFQRRSIVILPLCGRITRQPPLTTLDYFFAAYHAAALSAAWREAVNCFWLIKATEFH
jgi:hypothetical protein